MGKLQNKAAWLPATGTRMEVKPGAEPHPEPNEVVIHVACAAVNPVDWKLQAYDFLNLTYPWIFGHDIAGKVVQVGSAITRFKTGDRVIGHCAGAYTRKSTDCGFQLYSTCLEVLVAQIPDDLPFANAAVIPLGFDTACAAFYSKETLNLPFPSTAPMSKGKTILVWGGSSSVGSSAVQLAVASGFKVITTASPSNFELARSLGASQVFDYAAPGVEDKIIQALDGHNFAGAFDAISTTESVVATATIVGKLGGGFLPLTLAPPTESVPDNVKTSYVSGLAPAFEAPYIGPELWGKFLPAALKEGKWKVKPDPVIVKGGLEKVQEAIDLLKAGVSAKKIVVEIDGGV